MSSVAGNPDASIASASHARPGAVMGLVTIAMTLLGWSSVPLFITHFSGSMDFWTSNGWRYGFAALLWAPVLVVGYASKSLPRGLWRASVVPAAFNAIGQIAFAWSFYNIDPGTATFGLRLQILFVAAGAYMMFPAEREVLRRPIAWIGMLLVLGGTFGTIFLVDKGNMPQGVVGKPADYALGVGLSIFAGILFAAYGLSVRRFTHGFHPVTAFAAISQLTALVIVSCMLVFARDKSGHADFGMSAWHLSWGSFAWLLISAIIGIALGHVFYYISIARLGVAVSQGVVQLQPVCVAIAQRELLGIAMTSGQWVSGTCAVVGALMMLGVQWWVLKKAQIEPELEVEEPGS